MNDNFKKPIFLKDQNVIAGVDTILYRDAELVKTLTKFASRVNYSSLTNTAANIVNNMSGTFGKIAQVANDTVRECNKELARTISIDPTASRVIRGLTKCRDLGTNNFIIVDELPCVCTKAFSTDSVARAVNGTFNSNKLRYVDSCMDMCTFALDKDADFFISDDPKQCYRFIRQNNSAEVIYFIPKNPADFSFKEKFMAKMLAKFGVRSTNSWKIVGEHIVERSCSCREENSTRKSVEESPSPYGEIMCEPGYTRVDAFDHSDAVKKYIDPTLKTYREYVEELLAKSNEKSQDHRDSQDNRPLNANRIDNLADNKQSQENVLKGTPSSVANGQGASSDNVNNSDPTEGD